MWQSILIIKAFSVAILLLLGAGSFARMTAQVAEAASARKFDAFGQINGEDQSARLDNYAIQLQNEPASIGYVLAYGPEGSGWGTGRSILDIIKEYLVNSRGIASDRLQFTYAGRNSDLTKPKVELWIVPPTAPAPTPVEQTTNISTFKGMFAQVNEGDYIPIINRFDEDCCGPPVPDVDRASFADLMQVQKQARGYIVAFNGDTALPGAWKRVAERQVEDLKKHGVDESRLRIVFGGSTKKTGFQLWVTSANAPPPVKDAGPERPASKAVEVGTYSAEDLGNEENAKAIIDRVSESLRLQPTLRAYLIVRYGVPPEEEAEESSTTSTPEEPMPEEETQSPTPEPIEANIPLVIETWRKQLESKYKFGENRFVVVSTVSRDFEGKRLQIWLVPKDQPLPALDAEQEDEPGDF
jgi:hypothetical protein